MLSESQAEQIPICPSCLKPLRGLVDTVEVDKHKGRGHVRTWYCPADELHFRQTSEGGLIPFEVDQEGNEIQIGRLFSCGTPTALPLLRLWPRG